MLIGEPPRGLLLALDLLNTLRLDEGRCSERLATPADAVAWLAEHELGSDRLDRLRASPADAALLLKEMRRLREAVTRAVEAFRVGAPLPGDALFGIDRALSASRVVRRLAVRAGGACLQEEEHGDGPLAVLAPVALGAAELLTTTEAKRVRRCASERCDEWFVDTSKGGRRRWCSMERCGNRAKVAKHRRRKRQAHRVAGA